jgi:hypothetical protein
MLALDAEAQPRLRQPKSAFEAASCFVGIE